MTDEPDCDWCETCDKPWGQGDCPSCRTLADWATAQGDADDAIVVQDGSSPLTKAFWWYRVGERLGCFFPEGTRFKPYS